MNVTIYALVDPRTPSVIRYIGRTTRPEFRHLQHCSPGWGRNRKEEWVDEMRRDGIMPQMVSLAVVAPEEAEEKEKDLLGMYPETQLLNTRLQPTPVQVRPTKRQLPQSPSLSEKRDSFNREQVATALTEAKWNKTEAARILGVSRPTLYEMISKLGITK